MAKAPEQAELFQTLSNLDYTTTIYHTKSHVGIIRNEEVDNLCSLNKPTSERLKLEKTSQKTSTQVKAQIKCLLTVRRNKRITRNKKLHKDKSQTYHHMKRILKYKIEPPSTHKKLPRKESILLSKARTNRWTQCNWYLHFIKKTNDANCYKCLVKDTTRHVLDNCLLHEEDRQTLLLKLKQKYSRISDILCTQDESELSGLTKFLSKIEEERKQMEEVIQ